MQLVPVDEPSGGDITNLSVVLPAVPQSAQHLNVIRGFREILADLLLGTRSINRVERQARQFAAPEVSRRIVACGYLHPNPGPARADVVERGDRLGQMERLGVGDDRCRYQAYPLGARRDPGGDEYRIQPATDTINPVVGVNEIVGLHR